MQRLQPSTCIFLLCDVQERFRESIHKMPAVIAASNRMLRAATALELPVIATEQYPKGLGHTVAELGLSHEALAAHGGGLFEKTTFSMLDPNVEQTLACLKFTDAVIFGIEAHVCVQQTTLDLLERDVNVHLCVDGVSSQRAVDRAAGIHRASHAGAVLTTTESVMMELIRGKEHPSFKAISSILREPRLGLGELDFP
jgi:nicotinamidase-related amidase